MTQPTITLDYAVLDCPDPQALGEFYRDLLGWEITRSEDDWVVVRGPGQARLAFQFAPDFVPISWPDDGVKVHLDFVVEDLDEGERFATSLGATRLHGPDDRPDSDQPGFRVFADPAGQIFCLCRRSDQDS